MYGESITVADVKVGQTVRIRTWDGQTVRGTVEGVYENIKNDRPGIDYVLANGESYWAYLDQVV